MQWGVISDHDHFQFAIPPSTPFHLSQYLLIVFYLGDMISICTETWMHQIITFWPSGIPYGTGHICTITVIILVSVLDRECDQSVTHFIDGARQCLTRWEGDKVSLWSPEMHHHGSNDVSMSLSLMSASSCLAVTKSIHPSIYPSVHPSVYPPILQYICPTNNK